jgi:hypothetical protein
VLKVQSFSYGNQWKLSPSPCSCSSLEGGNITGETVVMSTLTLQERRNSKNQQQIRQVGKKMFLDWKEATVSI